MQPAVEIKDSDTGPAPIEELFRRHHSLVFRSACRITGNSADAEDVMQTVFLRLVRRPDSIGDVAGMESYLYRAAVNAALDVVRARQRSAEVAIDGAAPVGISDTRQAPDRTLDGKHVREWLRQAVARLSPASAEAFVLRFFEDKKNPEIARILGTTTSTVAVTLHRARERLEREYRAELGGAS